MKKTIIQCVCQPKRLTVAVGYATSIAATDASLGTGDSTGYSSWSSNPVDGRRGELRVLERRHERRREACRPIRLRAEVRARELHLDDLLVHRRHRRR